MEVNERIVQLLQILEDKYLLEGQEMTAYLEGLVYQDYLNYWDYVQTDVLLNLQHPRTNIPDEMIFIIYHQITELYFKLSLWEYRQILDAPSVDTRFLAERIRRINSYFSNLTQSFAIMAEGMEKEQFLKFRLALMPASGFQSAQYRMIEIASTPLINLVDKSHRERVRNASLEEQYAFIYWKFGATESHTGNKTLTLRMFEQKYADMLIEWARRHENRNLWTVYKSLTPEQQNEPYLLEQMHNLDLYVNVRWPMVHLKVAARYLKEDYKEEIPATGGTNWQQYLPPKIQRRVFFPELWSEEDLRTWGIRFNES